MSPAHIALFTFNRLEHTRRTVEALARNELASESCLHVFSDGPRTPTDAANVQAVRAYLKEISGFKSVEIIPRAQNLGLANSIISGVTEICRKYGRLIVLEDDLLTSPYFLRFMNEALEIYEADEEVISIHGYLFPVQKKLPETFFLKGAYCWGWATWSRGWDLFNPNGVELLNQLEAAKLTFDFDFQGSYAYTDMLRKQIAGANDSWAIRWHASAFVRSRLTLFPGCSLVRNIGNDGSGSHCGETRAFEVNLATEPVRCTRIPIAENTFAKQETASSFRALQPLRENPLTSTLKRVLKRCLPAFAWNILKCMGTKAGVRSAESGNNQI